MFGWFKRPSPRSRHPEIVHSIVGEANGETFILKFDPPVSVWQALKRSSEEAKRRTRAP